MLWGGRKKCYETAVTVKMNADHRYLTIPTRSRPGVLPCNITLSFVGLNYIIMGQVEEDGRGKVLPNSFVMSFKTKNQKILNALKNRTC